MQGFVTAIYEIGCLSGAIFILTCADYLGRRRAMIMGGTIMVLGVIIQVTTQATSGALAQFIIGRVIMGVGNGINTSTIPTYQAECSKTTNRGLLICVEGGIIAFGTLVAYWVDYGSSYGPAGLTWRFPIAFQIIFALIVAVPMIWLPESPRWLLTRGREEEGEKVIAALRGYEIHDDATQLEKTVILDSIRASGFAGSRGTPIKALFTNGKTQHFRRMTLGASSQLMQQLYPAEISPIKTRARANAVSTCTNWLFNFLIVMVTPIMIDHIGWGTYLFFAIVNACFLPIIYFFYPETRRRSLEEIDIIFAKGYKEKISYVRAAKELPYLSDEQVERMAVGFGLIEEEEAVAVRRSSSVQGAPKTSGMNAMDPENDGYGGSGSGSPKED
ncbi:MAG: hypothetical protein M1831_007586 [Alyxoria varia]|nr:MAG: hypothetical protein M1831_007586 [Alyxoria varia]